MSFHHLIPLLFTVSGLLAPVKSAMANVVHTYATGSDVPLTATTISGTANLTLGYAPATGTTLTVVNNPGPAFINGAFNNLAHGQVIALSYRGVNYEFVANYYGGNGNDLVLVWKNNRLVSWGRGVQGQLGNNGNSNALEPVSVVNTGVLANKTIIAVATGLNHSLALSADGEVFAWGYNYYGQVGDGSTDRPFIREPVAVDRSGVLAGRIVVAIAAGAEYSLALSADGNVFAWGRNSRGQLGDGSAYQDSFVPVQVSTARDLPANVTVAIAAGEKHSLALGADGILRGWGESENGRIGNWDPVPQLDPVNVLPLGDLPLPPSAGGDGSVFISAVGAGFSHSLAALSNGNLIAWGRNHDGQLGLGFFGPTDTPTSGIDIPSSVQASGVLAGKAILSAIGGAAHTVALATDGTVAAWGGNSDGQLGDGSLTDSALPVLLGAGGAQAGKTVVDVSAQRVSNVALCSDGTAVAWGNNASGQLGDGSIDSAALPVAVSMATLAPGERFTRVSSGSTSYHAIAIVASPVEMIFADSFETTP